MDAYISREGRRYPPIDRETRATIPTDAAAYHLNRKPQTLRSWACLDKGALRPIRINGRLAWPVAAIRQLLNGEDQ
jgi:hypothetical protein